MQPLSRPNFFPGQVLDYRDFNRLASYPDRATSLLCQHLYQGGGIVLGALEQLKVRPSKGLSVIVQPGMALLPSGQAALLNTETIIDLAPYCTKGTKTLVVSIGNSVQGEDRFEDETDPSITGYRSEALRAELSVSQKPSGNTIELFRVILNAGTELRDLPQESEWVVEGDALIGAIDTRYRRFVVPQTYYPESFESTLSLRKSLYNLDRDLTRIKRLFHIEDPFETRLYLSQLHAELLNRPYQPMKVSFLASETADKLSRFLEFLHRKAPRAQFSKKDLIATVKGLETLKAKGIYPNPVNLSQLGVVAEQLRVFTDGAYNRLTLVEHVEEAIDGLKDQQINLEEEIILAGHPFERVDRVLSDDARVLLRADNHHRRRQKAQFKNGDTLELDGLFVNRGVLSVEINVPNTDKPLVLLAHQYLRRGVSKLHFEWNGKPIETQEGSDNGVENSWQTKGIVIPPENLAPNNNVLRVRVERADLDYGFFDVNAYQPSQIQGGNDAAQ